MALHTIQGIFHTTHHIIQGFVPSMQKDSPSHQSKILHNTHHIIQGLVTSFYRYIQMKDISLTLQRQDGPPKASLTISDFFKLVNEV